jgi:hypothetical protein
MRRALSSPWAPVATLLRLLLATIARRRPPRIVSRPDDGRAGEVVAREHRGGGSVDVAHEQREILPGRLEPAITARTPKAAREDRSIVKLHGN